MKCNIRKLSNSDKKQIEKECQEIWKSFASKEEQKWIRKHIKLWCYVLNTYFGFGKNRLNRCIDEVENVAKEFETDEIFWHHLNTVMHNIGIERFEDDEDE